MQSVTKQIESNAIAAYKRARAMGATTMQLRVASTLPLSAHAARVLRTHKVRASVAGLVELAATAHMQRRPFQSDAEFTTELLAMRTAYHTMQVQNEVAA